MNRRSIWWRIGAPLFVLINVGGAIHGVVMQDGMHAAAHVGALLLGAFLVRQFGSRRAENDPHAAQLSDDRLQRLEQSLDAIAIELERIGEAQRFTAKLQQQQADPIR